MKFNRPLAATALAMTAALTLTSCSATTSEPEPSDRLRVVTTTSQLADFAAQVGGEEIELTSLLTPGSSAHHFDPSPADLLTLANADVLIINGAGLDEFVDSAIEASGFAGAVINASDGVDLDLAREMSLEALDGSEHDHEHDHEHEHDHADDEAGHAHAEGKADDHDHDHVHDHSDLNPHLWTSPQFAQGMVHEIGHGLAEADAAHAEIFEQRAHHYMHQLEELDAWVSAQFARVAPEDRVLVTGHDSMRYYLHDYNITFVGALLPSFEDNAEPSAAEIDALVNAIKSSGVKAIFVESSLNPKLAKTVATEAGVTVADEQSLYVDSLGTEGSGAETYIDATVHNTRVILEAWGAAIDPLPELQ